MRKTSSILILTILMLAVVALLFIFSLKMKELPTSSIFSFPIISLVISDQLSTPFFVPINCDNICIQKIKNNETLRKIAEEEGYNLDNLKNDIEDAKHGIKLQGYCYNPFNFSCINFKKGYPQSIDFSLNSRPKFIVKKKGVPLKIKLLLGIYEPIKKLHIREVKVNIYNSTEEGLNLLASKNISVLQICKKKCESLDGVNSPLCKKGCEYANKDFEYNCSKFLDKNVKKGCELFYFLEWKPYNFTVIDIGDIELGNVKGILIAKGIINASLPYPGKNCFSQKVWQECFSGCLDKKVDKWEEKGCFLKKDPSCLDNLLKCEKECNCSLKFRRSIEDLMLICSTFCYSRIGYFGDENKSKNCIKGCNVMYENINNPNTAFDYFACESELYKYILNSGKGKLNLKTFLDKSQNPSCIGAAYLYYINHSVVQEETKFILVPYVENIYSPPTVILEEGDKEYGFTNFEVYIKNTPIKIKDPIFNIVKEVVK